ncbi:MAG: DNA-processing protein DprA [Clostridia bacterium]|nr:DNA-processing protein DprA [Clostridia bacterium]
MSNSLKWIWLAEKCGQGSAEVLTLVERFGSIKAIYEADFDRYTEAGISERLAADLCDKSLVQYQKIVTYCTGADVGILCYDDESYPVSLRMLKNPPAVLYYMGELPDFNKRLCIAIVGTRKMSEYGMKAAYKIAYEVACTGAVVVSGLALGIDGIASCAAIAAKGTTVAVLGCGIDITYPKEHKKLKDIVKQNGAIITEYPPSTEPRGMNFPVRNRIISGLCQGTVVVDADEKSGAMITAKNAILQGRDVYAVPGNIDAENASGTNMLIRDGAQAVLCGRDVIQNYTFMYRSTLDTMNLFHSEKKSEFDPVFVRNMEVAMRVINPYSKVEFKDDGTHIGLKGVSKRASEKQERDKTAAKASEASKASPQPQRENPPLSETPSRSGGDQSAAVLEKLSEKQRRIFDEMPLDRAVTVDYLTKTGFALGEVISALTVLEIKGLVSSLPGALYVRK